MSEPASARSANILVVDDEPSARAALVELLRDEGYVVRGAADGFKALGQLDDWNADVVITDVCMPGMDGLELMQRLHERDEHIGVVVMTGHGSLENAMEAMHEGADDYITKPVQFPELLGVLHKALASHAVRRENERLEQGVVVETVAPGVEWVGESRVARELFSLARQVAESDATALIVGAQGTGKQTVARMLHAWSARSHRPFAVVRCGGRNEGVLARELFGAEPDAHAPGYDGQVELARGGTLFLDDVEGLTPALQADLLELLQERSYHRVGGHQLHAADVRVIAASAGDLHELVRAGRFRADLFYRLDVVTLRTPLLMQRRDDIPALATSFLRRHAAAAGKRIHGFTDRALRVLLAADWPGNITELDSCIERAVALCNGREIEPRQLPREAMQHGTPTELPAIPGASLAELERYAILKTLEHVRGSTSKAAEILGISPRKIQYRLAEYRGSHE